MNFICSECFFFFLDFWGLVVSQMILQSDDLRNACLEVE